MSEEALRRALNHIDEDVTFIATAGDARIRSELWQAAALLAGFFGMVMAQTDRQVFGVIALLAFCAWRSSIPIFHEWWQRLGAPLIVVVVLVTLRLFTGPR